MIVNETTAIKVAEQLLAVKAIVLSPDKPFTWASGWKSPIYCDNRKTLSFPKVRTFIRQETVKAIKQNFPDVEVIAGVATGGIAQGALVAEELNLPFIYVRSAPKGHGLTNMIEGVVNKAQKVVVIEDLISTGGSSLKAVDALRDAGCSVLGMVAIFSYGFDLAEENFKERKVRYFSLSDYSHLVNTAIATNYVTDSTLDTLASWRKNPESWKQS